MTKTRERHFYAGMTKREELKEILLENSVRTGDFTLASGKKSDFYVDCRCSTIHARGAILIGELGYELVCEKAQELGITPDSVGGMTLGADPITLAIAMESSRSAGALPLRPFVVRKEAKAHGMGRQIEGNFRDGDQVVVIEDTATTGGSALKAIKAIEEAGGKVAFCVVLVDRQEGGVDHIEAQGYPTVALFTRQQLLG